MQLFLLSSPTYFKAIFKCKKVVMKKRWFVSVIFFILKWILYFCLLFILIIWHRTFIFIHRLTPLTDSTEMTWSNPCAVYIRTRIVLCGKGLTKKYATDIGFFIWINLLQSAWYVHKTNTVYGILVLLLHVPNRWHR